VSFPEQPSQEETESNSIIDEFFGTSNKTTVDSPWAPGILTFAGKTVCKELKEEQRAQLIKQYEVKDNLTILGPPKLNKLLVPALKASTSIIKRDEYQAQAQAQVAASLNASGWAISELLGLKGKRFPS